MTLRDLLLRNFDSTNPDPERDRQGCRKRGMCDAIFNAPHEWGRLEGLPNFIIIKCDLTDADVEAYQGFRKVWRDQFDYEITATRPAQGEYDVRVFETAQGISGQNLMSGVKLTRVRDYLLDWGCSNFAAEANGGSFTFSLWDAVRSANFWNVNIVTLAGYSFALDSYTGGVGTITLTVPTMTEPDEINRQMQQITRKITERGGITTLTAYPTITFTIERSDILTRFRQDVKRRMERTFMYHQYRVNQAIMDQAVANGGILTLTKTELIAAIRDMAAE